MNFHTTARTATNLLTLALAGLAPVAAQAETTNDQWQMDLSIYGWFPSISGPTAFPSGGGGANVDVTAEDVIDSLKFAFMGSFGAKKGQWGLWTDLVYSDFGDSKLGSRNFTVGGQPVSASADLSLDLKSWVWTAAATYELSKSPENMTDLVFGTRLLDVQETLGWSFNGSGPLGLAASGTTEVSESYWDAIIGVKGVAYLGAERKWFVPYYLDIGTGQSDFTWQANAGIGYRYNWGAIEATWRYLGYEFSSGDPIQSLNFNGPLIGATFVW